MQATRFYGRRAERAALLALLLDEDTRLVTIVGAPGVGKTRLAVALGEELAPHCHGGVWFVALADVRDARLVTEAVLTSMGAPTTPGAEALDAVAHRVRGQPAVVVLDNSSISCRAASPW